MQVKLNPKDHLNPETELTYDTNNRKHRGVEGGDLDLDPVVEEGGMGEDEVETMVR